MPLILKGMGPTTSKGTNSKGYVADCNSVVGSVIQRSSMLASSFLLVTWNAFSDNHLMTLVIGGQ